MFIICNKSSKNENDLQQKTPQLAFEPTLEVSEEGQRCDDGSTPCWGVGQMCLNRETILQSTNISIY